MNAVQRAWRYITRGIGKTLLLIITFFVIGNLVILGLGISQAAENAKTLTRKQMRAAISYEVDYDAYYRYVDSLTDQDEINEAYKNYPKIDPETAIRLAEDSRVKALNYMSNMIVYSIGFDAVPVGNEEQRGDMFFEDGYVEPNVEIRGNLFAESIEITEGTQTILQGRFYNQEDIDDSRKVAVITKELAELNGLSVGDTITVSNAQKYVMNQIKEKGLPYTEEDMYLELEIIGIYDTLAAVDPGSDNYNWMSTWENPKNSILLPYTTYVDYQKSLMTIEYEIFKEGYGNDYSLEDALNGVGQPGKVIYLLNDPLEVDEFIKDHSHDIGEYLKLNANNDTFRKLARPLDTMSFFANIVVWIVVVNAIIIITLVTALTLKSREYEIGVLLSLGVSKLTNIGQLFLELFLIALVGFTLAVGSGSLLAGKVGKAVLDYQTATESQYETDEPGYIIWSNNNSYFTEVTQDELFSQYEVKVSPVLIGEIYLLGTAVVLIATLIPSIMIMRLNPKQILLEKN